MQKALPLFALLVVFAVGCGDSAGPDPQIEATRLESAKNLRSLFDKAHGDYAALSAEDKAAFVKLNGGDEAKAEKVWNVMKYGPGAAGGTSSQAAQAKGGR